MKRLALAVALAACAGAYAVGAAAQTDNPPPLPQLSAQQSADVDQKLSLYRTEIDGRVARGEITAPDAERLLAWRHWQLAQAAAGFAPQAGDVPPGPIADAPPQGRVIREYYYRPYYRPYYAPPPVYYPPPAYYAPAPAYWWGPSVCLGGFGHHFGGRACF